MKGINPIFRYFLTRDDDSDETIRHRKALISWFCVNFPANEFKEEDAVMWHLMQYIFSLGADIKERYVDVYLEAELRNIIQRKRILISDLPNKNIDNLATLDEVEKITKNVVKTQYYQLVMMEANTEDFEIDMTSWMREQLEKRIESMVENTIKMTHDMVKKRVGLMESLSYTAVETKKLREIYDIKKLRKIKGLKEKNKDEKLRFLTDTGLPGVDKDVVGLFGTHLWTIEAGYGIGKTRICIGTILYRAYIKYKRRIYFRALEQEKEEINAMFIARHIYELYSEVITDRMITTELDPDGQPITEHQKNLIAAARYDFFESGKYGYLYVNDEKMYIDDFVEDLELDESMFGPFDILVIDNMPWIQQREDSKFKNMSDWEIIKKAYRLFKDYLRDSKTKGGIAINQANDEGIKASKQGKVSTSAAGGLEGRRTSDYILTLGATEAQEELGQRTVHNPKKRSSKGLGKILLETYLGCCYFVQSVTKNKVA